METITLLVPGDRAGKVIGKGGSGLKEAREGSGCKIALAQDPDSNGFRRATFEGNADQIGAGFHTVCMKAFQGEDAVETSLQVMIPPERAGTVIGKGGEHLKRVRELTSVGVQVDRDPVTNATGVPERAVSLKGEARYMGAAIRMALSFAGQPNGGGGGSGGGGAVGVGHAPMARPMAVAQGGHPAAVSGSMGLSQVRVSSDDPEEMQLHMAIPGKFAGSVLGKEGMNVKRIQQETACKNIAMTKRENSSSDRRVIIVGNYTSAVAAQQACHALYAEAAGQEGITVEETTVIYMVPRNAAGGVIGKGAVGLKNIREQSAVRKCDVGRDEVNGQRPCTIIGPLHAVLLAERLIQQSVQAALAGGGGGGDDGLKRAAAGGAIEPAPKRARMDGGGGVGGEGASVKLLVPSGAAGAVIGKGGSGLKTLREGHGVHIEMLSQQQAPHWPQDRVVILRGPMEGKQTAVDAILRMAYAGQEANMSLKLLVPASSAGAVIGKGGAMLKGIREQCGAHLDIQRDEILGDRLITATGPMANVVAGAQSVVAVVDGAGGSTPALQAPADLGAADPADGQAAAWFT